MNETKAILGRIYTPQDERRLIAIDPGNVESAFVLFNGERPLEYGKWDNRLLLNSDALNADGFADHLAIETLKPRGMPTSFEEMQTQLWAGRFIERWRGEFTQVFRSDVKMHICGQAKANDSNIRQALIDRYGGQDKAIGGKRCQTCKGKGNAGTKRQPLQCWTCGGNGKHPPEGPLFGISADVWSALAISCTYWDKNHQPHPTPGA
jgi:hypothetical protein